MFQEAYVAALRHYKADAWYHATDIWTGSATHLQFTSLQAFWPGVKLTSCLIVHPPTCHAGSLC